MRIKTPKGEKVTDLLICVLCFCLVAFLCFWCFWCFQCFWYFWCFWCVQSLFLKKKEFKTALITAFTLLLKIYLITSLNFFNHNLFQSSQSFSVITIFFNYQSLLYYSLLHYNLLYHNLFYHSLFNLFTTTIFMKIRQSTNSII